MPLNKNLAVIIGIDQYLPGIPTLTTAVADATAFSRILREQHGYTVLPPPAKITSDSLKTFLDVEVRQQVDAETRLIFYFAGHGIAVEGDDGPDGYFVLQNASPNDLTSLQAMKEIHDLLCSFSCHHVLIILDCCFAGAFRWASMRNLQPLASVLHLERYARYLQYPAWQLITSASYNERALSVLHGFTLGERSPDGQHSPFALALFKALEGAADIIPVGEKGKPTGDGVITATELYVYLDSTLRDACEQRAIRQTVGIWPLKKHDRGEFVFRNPTRNIDPLKELPAAPELNEQANPWRGLDSYSEDNAFTEDPHSKQKLRLFFGRDDLTANLRHKVENQPLTIVVGASGTGKSSVVKAGLLPELRNDPAHNWCIVTPVRPGTNPLETLAGIELPISSAPEVLERSPTTNPTDGSLCSMVGVWAKANPDSRLVLVVDQFEELITQCIDQFQRNEFIRQLTDSIVRYGSVLRVVLTVRSDFETQFSGTTFQNIGDHYWMNSRVVVPPLTQVELRDVIEGPASAREIYFESRNTNGRSESLIDELINDVLQTPGALPLLSFTLSELYRRYVMRRSDDRCLTFQDYDALGRVGGSLRNRANEIYRELPSDAHRKTMRRIMLRMVSLEGGELSRRRAPRSELVFRSASENRRVEDVIFELVNSRLVIAGSEADGFPFLEPAHDALIQAWDKIGAWARDHRVAMTLLRLLTPAANDWKSGTGGLWDFNPRLSLVREQLRTAPDLDPGRSAVDDTAWLNAVESEFVDQSIQRRRTTISSVIGSVTVAFVILGLLTQYAFRQRNQASLQRDRAQKERYTAIQRLDSNLVTDAVASLTNGDPVGALPQLDASLRLEINRPPFRGRHDDEARAAAHRLRFAAAVDASPSLRQLWAHDDLVNDAVISPNGQLCATICHDGRLRVWSLATGMRQFESEEMGVGQADFSPDSKQIVLCGQGGIQVVELSTGNSLFERSSQNEKLAFSSAYFSKDGRALYIVLQLLDADVEHFGMEDLLKSLSGAAKHRAGFFVWDLDSEHPQEHAVVLDGLMTATLTHRRDAVLLRSSVVVSPGKHSDQTLVWNASTNETQPLPLNQLALVGFSETTDSLLLTAPDGIALFDIHRQKAQFAFEQAGAMNVAVNPDSTVVAFSTYDRTVHLVDVSTNKELAPPLPHSANITFLLFSPDLQWLVSGCDDGIVRLWNTSTGKLAAPPLHHGVKVIQAKFTPDSRLLLTTTADGVVRLWDPWPRQQRSYDLREEPYSLRVDQAFFAPKQNAIIAATTKETLGDNRRDYYEARKFDPTSGLPSGLPMRHPQPIHAIQVSEDGRWLATSCLQKDGAQSLIHVWNLETCDLARAPLEVGFAVLCLDWSKDAGAIALGGRDKFELHGNFSPQGILEGLAESSRKDRPPKGRVALFDLAAGLSEIQTRPEPVQVIRFYGNNNQVFTYTGSSDEALSDAQTGDSHAKALSNWPTPAQLDASLGASRSFTVGSSPNHIVSIEGRQDRTYLQVWDILKAKATSSRLQVIGNANTVRLDLHDSRMAIACDTDVHLFDLKSGRESVLRHPFAISAICFSHDGQLLLTASDSMRVSDGAKCSDIRIWDAETGLAIGSPILAAERVDNLDLALDRSQMVVQGHKCSVYRVPSLEFPDHQRADLAAVLSGKELTEQGNLQVLTSKALGERWERLHRDRSDSMQAEDIEAWHASQTAICKGSGNWFGMAWHAERQHGDRERYPLWASLTEAYEKLATTRLDTGHVSESEVFLTKAIELHGREECLHLRAVTLAGLERFREAFRDCLAIDERRNISLPADPLLDRIRATEEKTRQEFRRRFATLVSDSIAERVDAWALACQGWVHFDEGNFAAAKADLTAAMEIGVSSSDIKALLARVDLELGNVTAALDNLSEIPSQSSDSYSLCRTRWRALAKHGRYRESVREILRATEYATEIKLLHRDAQEMLDLFPAQDQAAETTDPFVLVGCGFAHLRLVAEGKSELSKAIKDFEHALTINPPGADRALPDQRTPATECHTGLGFCYFGQDNFVKAIEEFTAAIDSGADHWRIWQFRAWCYGRLGKWPQATSDTKSAIAQGDPNALLWKDLGYCQAITGELTEATKSYEMFLSKLHGDSDADFFVSLANVYWGAGALDQAVNAYTKAIEHRPADWTLYRNRAYLQATQGNWREAAANLQVAIDHVTAAPQQFTSDEALLWTDAATAFAKCDDPAGRRLIVRSTQDILAQIANPDVAGQITVDVLSFSDRRVDWTPFRKAIESQAKEHPDNYWAALGLGVTLFRQGQLSDAITQLNNAVKLNVDPVHAWIFLSMAYRDSGDVAAAENWRRLALQYLAKATGTTPDQKVPQLSVMERAKFQILLGEDETSAASRAQGAP